MGPDIRVHCEWRIVLKGLIHEHTINGRNGTARSKHARDVGARGGTISCHRRLRPAGVQRLATAWDRYEYDRHHVILGVVGRFEPYRLQIERRDGVWQTIDLKDGTVILPTGATPQPSQRVAIVGYYSKGTFVANRVILRN